VSATATPTLSRCSLSPLNATLMRLLASAANKRLTAKAKPFRCNTYRIVGEGGAELLFVAERDYGIDAHGTPRGDVGR